MHSFLKRLLNSRIDPLKSVSILFRCQSVQTVFTVSCLFQVCSVSVRRCHAASNLTYTLSRQQIISVDKTHPSHDALIIDDCVLRSMQRCGFMATECVYIYVRYYDKIRSFQQWQVTAAQYPTDHLVHKTRFSGNGGGTCSDERGEGIAVEAGDVSFKSVFKCVPVCLV